LTDCLNFGNPEKVAIMSEFVASVEALAQVAEVFDSPVVSGNVSFYNETQDENIVSTPAVGVIGLRKEVLGIPPDSIQDLSGKYVLSVEYKGLFFGFDRSLEIRNGFLKDLSSHLARLKDFHEFVLSMGVYQDVVCSKVLGYESLAKEMEKIFGASGGEIQTSYLNQWQAQGRDESRRPLYIAIFAVNESARSEIETKILEHLGSVEAFWLK
jgi:phosphoribosylformylglycinamidine (FGAM) synthase-like enzyme